MSTIRDGLTIFAADVVSANGVFLKVGTQCLIVNPVSEGCRRDVIGCLVIRRSTVFARDVMNVRSTLRKQGGLEAIASPVEEKWTSTLVNSEITDWLSGREMVRCFCVMGARRSHASSRKTGYRITVKIASKNKKN